MRRANLRTPPPGPCTGWALHKQRDWCTFTPLIDLPHRNRALTLATRQTIPYQDVALDAEGKKKFMPLLTLVEMGLSLKGSLGSR